jgi:hypothetical protein
VIVLIFIGLKPHAIGLNVGMEKPIASEFIPREMNGSG